MKTFAIAVALFVAIPAISCAAPEPPLVSANAFPIRGMKGLFWDGIDKYYKALDWMADHRMNWLMLCYTAYPESATDWRKDYTPQHLAEMKELVTRANDKGVTICLSFNPGIWSKPPLNHSSEDDYQASWRKVKAAHSIGIRWIALCLDDISRDLLPDDKAKYGTLQAAQMALTNRLWQDMKNLDPSMRLIFCPSAYTTEEMNKHLEYTTYVGEHLDSGIDIFWTGPGVCSVTITEADARYAEKLFRRKPFIWDNYPVNDMFANTWRPLLAPVKGREAHLPGATTGIVFNPMKQWEINRIPMVSVADYLADPVNYNPQDQMKKTLRDFTPDERPAITLMLRYYGNAFWGDKGFPPAPRATTREQAETIFNNLQEMKQLLTREGSTLKPMWEEIRPIVEQDLALMEMLKQPGTTRATAWKGGAPELAEKAFGEPTGLVYAASTGKNRIVATLDSTGVSHPRRLRLLARNGDGPKPTVRIVLNGQVVAEGEMEFSASVFETREFEIPSSVQTADEFELVIENTVPEGKLGMPPWFAAQWIQLLP